MSPFSIHASEGGVELSMADNIHVVSRRSIFFFQLDSVICGQSDKSLNDFLGTDVVPGGYSWLGGEWSFFFAVDRTSPPVRSS